ncbi:MAG: matrixin family metalloprotease [Pseudomonadota bacterium]
MHKLMYLGLLLAVSSHAQDFKSYPMPSERERPNYVLGSSLQAWPGGQVNWYYNPLNQPSNLSTSAVVASIQRATARWSGMCRVSFNYLGTTSVLPNLDGPGSSVDQVNVFGWGVLQGENAAYSAVTKSWWIGSGFIDADIVMNTAQFWTLSEVDGIMTHEIGHALGLGHSDTSASVMFASPYHSTRYMSTLRGDDANGCAALYGAATTADSNRAFNWAEAAYAQYLWPSLAASGTLEGYYYRYYSGSQSYVGTRDGTVYFMGPDGVIQNMGSLGSYLLQVRNAGY